MPHNESIVCGMRTEGQKFPLSKEASAWKQNHYKHVERFCLLHYQEKKDGIFVSEIELKSKRLEC